MVTPASWHDSMVNVFLIRLDVLMQLVLKHIAAGTLVKRDDCCRLICPSDCGEFATKARKILKP